MTDKNILISDLNDISDILINNGYGGWCATIQKVLDLLNEHDSCENCAIAIEDRQSVVRCEDCDNKECWGREGNVVCGIDGTPHRPDWFCAYGKKKRL